MTEFSFLTELYL